MADSTTDRARSTLGRQIRRGVSWNAANLVVNKGMSILVRLLLARLLVPEHFGLVAMVVVVLGLIKIFVDFGLQNALIQRKRDAKSLIRNDSAFWFLLGGGIGWTALFIIAGIPLMIWAYDEPQLRDLALVMSVSILLHSLSIMPTVRLTRRMRFKSQVIAEVVSTVVASVIAIALAFAGAGVWALAAQQISTFAIKGAMLWRAAAWRPRRRFVWASLQDVLSFSGWMLGNQVIHYLRKNVDKVLVGAMLGAGPLGIYTLAYMLTETIRVHIGTVVSKVMFPAYSRSQTDLARVRRLYLGVIRYTTLVVFPIATFMILLADPLVPKLFGEAWREAIGPLQILALASIVFASLGDPSAVLRGIGFPRDVFLISSFTAFFVAFPAIYFGAAYAGINGAAWAVVGHYAVSRILFLLVIRSRLSLGLLSICAANLPAITGSALFYVFITYLKDFF